jgi:hypothetical protein
LPFNELLLLPTPKVHSLFNGFLHLNCALQGDFENNLISPPVCVLDLVNQRSKEPYTDSGEAGEI